jgi:outer membrane protein assembly factor BamB
MGSQLWLTTALETPAKPEDVERRLAVNTGGQPLTLLEEVELRAICLNRATGVLDHNTLLHRVREPQWVHKQNSYASPTSVIEDGRLYCHFGTFGTFCLDTETGEVVWANTNLKVMHENGPGSSPMLWKDLLIFHLDGSDQQSIAALNRDTGRLAWQTRRSGKMHSNPQLKKSYGTPLVMEVNGQMQILSPASNWLYSYDASGRELWKLSYGILGFSITPRPVAGHGMLFLSTSFSRPEILAIRYETTSEPSVVWRFRRGAPLVPSPLLVDDELYFISDSGGLLTCLDAHSGQEHYRERLGGNYSASPTYADGKIYLCSREGLTSVVKPGKQFKRLAANPLSGQIFASLAAVDGAFFLRTDKALYRIEED